MLPVVSGSFTVLAWLALLSISALTSSSHLRLQCVSVSYYPRSCRRISALSPPLPELPGYTAQTFNFFVSELKTSQTFGLCLGFHLRNTHKKHVYKKTGNDSLLRFYSQEEAFSWILHRQSDGERERQRDRWRVCDGKTEKKGKNKRDRQKERSRE